MSPWYSVNDHRRGHQRTLFLLIGDSFDHTCLLYIVIEYINHATNGNPGISWQSIIMLCSYFQLTFRTKRKAMAIGLYPAQLAQIGCRLTCRLESEVDKEAEPDRS